MAGGGKESPRQKMIGMMYLVLTALLAMNVAKNVLDIFVTVNESLERSNLGFADNSNRVMKSFEEAKASNPSAIPYYAKAVEAKKLTTDLFDYMEKLKHELISHTAHLPSGGDTLRLRYVDAKDDNTINTHLLIGDNEKSPKTGEFSAVELKEKITTVHDKLLKMVQDMQKDKKTQFLKDDYDALIKKIEGLKPDAGNQTEEGNPISWEILNFYHNPLAGVITNLSKIESDVKNVEAELINQLSGASGKVSIKFNQLTAKVVAPSSYIQAGQPYKADIFLAASSSDFKDENMQVLVGVDSASAAKGAAVGTKVNLVGGMGKYEVGTGGQGLQTYKGVIKFKKPTGEYDYYPFEQEYMVAAPSVAVSATKMNVFYIGVDNPLSVSAAGVSPTDLVVSVSGGASLRPDGAGGKYIVKASAAGVCKITVSAKTKDGTKPQGPPIEFRVKKIPDPVPSVAGKRSGMDIKKSEAQGIGGILAVLDNFDFQANFVVTSYEFGATIKGTYVSYVGAGPGLTQEMKSALSKVTTGSKLYFENVKAKGPDGSIRNIGTLALKVKG